MLVVDDERKLRRPGAQRSARKSSARHPAATGRIHLQDFNLLLALSAVENVALVAKLAGLKNARPTRKRIRDIADRVLWLEDGGFKELSTMAIDPVCHMAVEQATAVAAQLKGKTYYFCSRGCEAEFLSGADEFLGVAVPYDRPDPGQSRQGRMAP